MTDTTERGGDMIDRYLTTDEPESTVTDEQQQLQPYRWTETGELQTDPRGITPAQKADTARVQHARTSADEAELLLDVQQRDRSHLVDSRKVRNLRSKVAAAGKTKQLKADADFVALRDARVRLWTTVAALVAAVAALGWSTASVQITAANGAPAWSSAWLLAFLVEPLISVGLLATIGVQAYAAMRGHVVDKHSDAGRTLHRTQVWLLVLTVTLNVWPYIRPLWTSETFDLVQVIIHLVGPIVAVRMIHSLPAMWSVLEDLPGSNPTASSPANPAPAEPAQRGVTPLTSSENAPAEPVRRNPSPADVLTARVAPLIASGEWQQPVSAKAIQRRFGVGMDVARAARDQINETEFV